MPKLNWKIALCSLYLIFQLGMIVASKFSDNRYFVWAPHDIQTEYKLIVTIEGDTLSRENLVSKFGLFDYGIEDLPPSHLFERITEYHRAHPEDRLNTAIFNYSVNGKQWDTMSFGKENDNE